MFINCLLSIITLTISGYVPSVFTSLELEVGDSIKTTFSGNGYKLYQNSCYGEVLFRWLAVKSGTSQCKDTIAYYASCSSSYTFDEIQELFLCSGSKYSVTVTDSLPNNNYVYVETDNKKLRVYHKFQQSQTTKSIITLVDSYSFSVNVYQYSDDSSSPCYKTYGLFGTLEATTSGTSKTYSTTAPLCQPYSITLTDEYPTGFHLYYKKGSSGTITAVSSSGSNSVPLGDSSSFYVYLYIKADSGTCSSYTSIGSSISVNQAKMTKTISEPYSTCYTKSVTITSNLPTGYTLYHTDYHYPIRTSQTFYGISNTFTVDLLVAGDKYCKSGAALKTITVNSKGMTVTISEMPGSCYPYYITIKNSIPSSNNLALYYKLASSTTYNAVGTEVTVGDSQYFYINVYAKSTLTSGAPCLDYILIENVTVAYDDKKLTISSVPSRCLPYSITITNSFSNFFTVLTNNYQISPGESKFISQSSSFTLTIKIRGSYSSPCYASYETADTVETITVNTYEMTKSYSTPIDKCYNFSLTITNSLPTGYELKLSSSIIPRSSTGTFYYYSSYYNPSETVYVRSGSGACKDFVEIETIQMKEKSIVREYSGIPAFCKPYSIRIYNKLNSRYTLYAQADSQTQVEVPRDSDYKYLDIGDDSRFSLNLYLKDPTGVCSSLTKFEDFQVTESGMKKTYDTVIDKCKSYVLTINNQLPASHTLYYRDSNYKEVQISSSATIRRDDPFNQTLCVKSNQCYYCKEIDTIQVNAITPVEKTLSQPIAECQPYYTSIYTSSEYTLYYRKKGDSEYTKVTEHTYIGSETPITLEFFVEGYQNANLCKEKTLVDTYELNSAGGSPNIQTGKCYTNNDNDSFDPDGAVIAVIVIVVVVVVVGAVIGIVLFLRWRKRKKEETEPTIV